MSQLMFKVEVTNTPVPMYAVFCAEFHRVVSLWSSDAEEDLTLAYYEQREIVAQNVLDNTGFLRRMQNAVIFYCDNKVYVYPYAGQNNANAAIENATSAVITHRLNTFRRGTAPFDEFDVRREVLDMSLHAFHLTNVTYDANQKGMGRWVITGTDEVNEPREIEMEHGEAIIVL